MNILYINHYAGGPAYGMEFRPYYLAREWVRAGHKVTIVAASQSHVRSRQPETAGEELREEWVDGIRFVWCETPRYQGNGVGRVVNIFAFLRRLGQWRQWLTDVPDVVIASSTYPLDIRPARRIARRHGAKLVWEVHDLWPLSPMELGGMSRWHPFIMLLQHAENRACRDADVVVSMLPHADLHLRAHGMAASKFVYVPNGIDPDEWSGTPASLPPAHSNAIAAARERGHLLVAYAGAHGIANALHAMLDAAALIENEPVTLLMIGSGPEKEALRAQATARSLKNVVLLDPVPKAAIPALLRSMDVLYIGLQRQSLFRFGISPNTLMDYMMAARPVICAIESGNDPVGEAGCGLTIAPENPPALAEAIRRLARTTPEELDEMGRRGRRYVEAEHSYPVLARRFLAALES